MVCKLTSDNETLIYIFKRVVYRIVNLNNVNNYNCLTLDDNNRGIEMTKILVIITTELVQYGGLASVMLNYYRSMNRKNFQIDFASTNEIDEELKTEFHFCNTKYYNLGKRKNILRYIYNLMNVVRKEKYDIVHVNGNSSTMVLELLASKAGGVKRIIAHGHAARSSYPIIHKLLHPVFCCLYTDAIAVSKKTGDWLFKDEYHILNNAIDTEKYSFNQELRKKIREEYNIQDKFVIGNVGKLNQDKNHIFLIQLFCEIKKEKDNAMLLLVGGGALEDELRRKVEDFGISDSVIFTGMLNDTSGVLQAMDVFVFPSKFEGFGMALVEAQAAGLMCVSSDSVPLETKVSKSVYYLSLNENKTNWIEKIINSNSLNRTKISEENCKSIAMAGYDIHCEAEKLRKIYEKC